MRVAAPNDAPPRSLPCAYPPKTTAVVCNQTATLGEWQLRTEQAISGVRTLTIQVSAN